MPLTAQILESKLIDEIAPGNPERFLQILSEADELLLNSGKWRWVRKPLELTPVNGRIILPDGYESIVGARLGSEARGIGWQEVEFLEDGPGLIPIQGGCEGRLVDEGLLNLPDGTLDFSMSEFDLTGPLLPSVMINGRISYTSTGKITPGPDMWAKCFYDGADFRFQLLEAGVVIAGWTALTGTTPDEMTWDHDDPSYGSLVTSPHFSLQRCYKVTDGNVDSVTVLARYEAATLDNPLSVPRCPSFSALKRAMMSINFESNNDIVQATNYFMLAKQALDEQESAYRGSAKQVHKPAMFGPPRRRKQFP